jgi:hypothetical protein
MKQMVIAGLALLISSGDCLADFVTSDKLNDLCTSNKLMVGVYVAGLSDYANWDIGPKSKGVGSVNFCVRENVSVAQLADIVCGKLAERAGMRDMPAPIFVSLSLRDAFPCKQ